MRVSIVRRLKPSVLALQLVLRRAELGVLKSETVSPSNFHCRSRCIAVSGSITSLVFDSDFEHPMCGGFLREFGINQN